MKQKQHRSNKFNEDFKNGPHQKILKKNPKNPVSWEKRGKAGVILLFLQRKTQIK